MTSLAERLLAVLAIGLVLWTAGAAVSSSAGIHSDWRLPTVREQLPSPEHHASPSPLAALDANGDGIPDAVLRRLEVSATDQPAVRHANVATEARRLTGLQITPLSSPPR